MAFSWNHWITNTVILLIFIIYLLYRYMIRNFNYWKERGVVYIPPSPFFGNFGECFLGRASVGGLSKDVYNYAPNEPYVGVFGLDKPILVIRDLELIKHILIKDFDYFKDRYANSGDHDNLKAASLFALKNPAWKILRTKITPIYSSGRLKKMVILMMEVGQDLITHLESLDLKEPGQMIEVMDLCARLTTDMIATTAFGLRANSLNNPNAEFRERGKELFSHAYFRNFEQAVFLPAPQLVKLFRAQMFPKKFAQFMRTVVWDAIDNREKSGLKRHDLIDVLIELKNQDADNPEKDLFQFKGDNIVAQAALFFAAGFESSANVMTFCLYELALNPEIQNRLRKEIIDAVKENGEEITYEMIMQLPYLDMVVSETLRKYPPLPLLNRVADSDYRVPGTNLVIEEGTPVYIPLLGLHSDPKYHENPEKFDPERFSDVNKEATKRAWFPFGDGPHVCIAQRLGALHTKIGLIEMLRGYECSPCDRTPIPMKLARKGLVTAPEGELLYLNVKKIN